MIIKQISIFVENRAGRLAEVTEIIANNNINLRALSLADTTNFGILRIIVDEPNKVEKILRENGMTVSVDSVLSICVDDKPGGLAQALKVLADNNMDIEYLYAFVSKQDNDKAYVIMRIEEEFKALEALKNAGYYGFEIGI